MTLDYDATLKFDEPLKDGVASGEIAATVRYDDEKEIAQDDVLELATPDGEPFAYARVDRMGIGPIRESLTLIDLFGATHSCDTTEELLDALNGYYEPELYPETMVKVLTFTVIE